VSPRAFAIGLIVLGVLQLVLGFWRIASTGSGSGFKGWTLGFRLKSYAAIVAGVLAIAFGIYGVVRLPH
jgi:hypothetical protein